VLSNVVFYTFRGLSNRVHYYGDQIMEDEMGGHAAHKRHMRSAYRNVVGNLKGRHNFTDLCVDGKIIVIRILKSKM